MNFVFFVLGTNTHPPLCMKRCRHRPGCVRTHMRTTALQDEDRLQAGSFQTAVSSTILRHFDFSFISCIWANALSNCENTHGKLLQVHRQLGVHLV